MKQTKYVKNSLTFIFSFFLLLYSCMRTEVALTPKVQEKSQKPAFTLSEAQMQLANIKVAEVTTGALRHQLLLTGVLKVDEQSVVSVSSWATGRIQKLYFKNTGEKVNIGDPLYEFYSEDLLAKQREYKALQDNNWNFSGKYDQSIALENKLILLGMLPSQITQLKLTKKLESVITICSSQKGIIRSVNATEGQYVNAGEQIFELADDSNIWVEAQVYLNELQFLSVGMAADVIVPVAGDLRIHNKISFINPAFEKGRNVILVRAIVSNPDKLLYPGMLALLSVQTQMCNGIIIPASAVLIEKSGSLVWVQKDDGSFERRAVTTGIQSSDSVLVLSGLREFEKVVISGVYLLNSENILNRWSDATAKSDM